MAVHTSVAPQIESIRVGSRRASQLQPIGGRGDPVGTTRRRLLRSRRDSGGASFFASAVTYAEPIPRTVELSWPSTVKDMPDPGCVGLAEDSIREAPYNRAPT